jgi:hypothetical protein
MKTKSKQTDAPAIMHTIPGIDGRDLHIIKVMPPILPDMPDCEERIMVLTGRRRVADRLTWSASCRLGESDYSVYCQGLHKGSYGDSKVKASDLLKFMTQYAPRSAVSFKRAFDAWLS